MSPDRHLQAFVDALYAEVADASPLGILAPLYAALRQRVDFTAASFLQFAPPDWTVAACYTHEIWPDGLPVLAGQDHGMAGEHLCLPGLQHPNKVIGLGACFDVAQVLAGGFGDGLRRLAEMHGVALVPFVRGMPIGAFEIYRPVSMLAFGPEERSVFRWHVTQAARALDYRRLVERTERSGPAILIVAPEECRLISLTDVAQALLAALPEGETLTVPADADHAALWVLGEKTYVVRSMDFLPDLILSTGAIGNLSLIAATDFARARLRFAPGSTRRRALVLIEPLEQAVQARGKLLGFGLTPRQEEVVLLLAHGKGVKDIARACGISFNTAKDHVADIYQRLGVHSREALLAKLTGTTPME